MFAKLADAVMKHSKVIIAIWIVLIILSVPFMLKVSEVYEYDMTKMAGSDSESSTGYHIMEDYFAGTSDMGEVVVIKYSGDVGKEDALTLGSAISAKLEGMGITVSEAINYSKDGVDGIIMYGLSSKTIDLQLEAGNIRNAVSQCKADTGISMSTYVTGNDALTYDTMDSSNKDVEKIDPMSVALILILLIAFFGALVTSIVPPMGFGVAYAVVMMATYLIGQVTSIFYLTSTLVMVTMLGAGCDYGIFIITRYREELKKGAGHESALRTAIEWAGESVFTSGMSVIIGFACLAICNFMLVRTMGVVLAVGIVFALIAALTFVPSVINLIGEKVFWPNTIEKYKGVENGTNNGLYAKMCRFFGGYFKWVAKVTRKYSVPIVVVAVLISVPALYVYSTSSSSYDMIAVEPDGEAKEGLNAMMEQTAGGTLMPTYVVIEFPENAVDTISSVDIEFMGKAVATAPFMVWSTAAVSGDLSSGYTGYVVDLNDVVDEIKVDYTAGAEGCIVESAYTIDSWEYMYYQAYQLSATHDVNEINKVLKEDVKATYPSAVYDHVETYIGLATMVALMEGTSATPDLVLATDSTGREVTLANLIDYVMDCGVGTIATEGTGVGWYATINIITSEKPMSDNTMDFVSDIYESFHKSGGYDSQFPSTIKCSYVCGTNAIIKDISVSVNNQFTVIQIIVVVLLLILLFVILGCYLTPVRAMPCIIVSVIWTLALTYTVFQGILNTPVCWIVPIVLFVVLLGLGMDYDIFITTRVRENKVRGMSNDDAIDAAICSASGTISLCALIMGGTFLTLLVATSSMLIEFGFALGVGILIDGLVMVTFVGPAIMHLMGEWSWKGPRFLQRKKIE